MQRIDSNFKSQGVQCAGWLYLPEGVMSPPVVIMAHGFAGERELRLPEYASRFANLGLAVFLFDYRCFGGSQGQPRNWVSPKRHLQDWESAIAHVRSLDQVDSGRLALWGTSFSGGHVLVVAARVPGISCVVSQIPSVDGLASAASFNPRFMIQAMAHGALDFVGSKFGRPHWVPVVGPSSRFAVLNTPDAEEGVKALIPEGLDFPNKCLGRVVFEIPFYRPVLHAGEIDCPVLMIYGEHDTLIPAKAVKKTVKKIKNVRAVSLPVGHFDVYLGEWFEKTVRIQGEFLQKNLLAAKKG